MQVFLHHEKIVFYNAHRLWFISSQVIFQSKASILYFMNILYSGKPKISVHVSVKTTKYSGRCVQVMVESSDI